MIGLRKLRSGKKEIGAGRLEASIYVEHRSVI